jgi:hypothetical protein
MPFVILPTNSASGGYDITNSLRFNSGSSDYLSRTPSSTTNRKTFTISSWFKRSKLGALEYITGATSDAWNLNYFLIYINSSDQLNMQGYTTAGASQFAYHTTQVFRDVSAWYHLVIAVDTTQATSTNRIKIYLNGNQITTFITSDVPTQNIDTFWNSTNPHYIGQGSGGSYYFNGYQSDFYSIDGQALTPSSFGETDFDTGIWKPKAYTGTYGTNGFYLQFKNSASLGTDSSGNGNTFTVNNLTSIDQTTDTPTNNFCTLNPLDVAPNQTFTEGNLAVLWSALNKSNRANFAVDTGKWYWEVKVTSVSGGSGNGVFIGISNSSHDLGTWIGANANSWGYYASNGKIYTNNNGGTTYGNSYTLNDIINIAYDATNGKLYFGKNGTWQNSGDPVTATNPAYSSLSGLIFPSSSAYTDNSLQFNFGNPPYTGGSYTDGAGYGNFSYAVPSGYYSLNTRNLANFG